MNFSVSDQWARLSTMFDVASELPLQQREAYIVLQCAGDAHLEQRLRRMLAADEQAQSRSFLESPALPERLQSRAGDSPVYEPGSRRFGPYRLIKLIGVGGMGEVHLAERNDGQFEQRVALKLLPHPTPGLMQRFRQERQILARLEHPNIARLLDGGIGEANVPYFAMEYIEGTPIVDFVSRRQLQVPAILRLFLAVCSAVQYAHSNLVVHRDIKPSNILVGVDGTPKLLDFGIAKVLQATDDHMATQTNVRVFTPDYAAPEQIRGESVTTATDVYALGIVLYELLTGSRPYKFRRDMPLEQAIVELSALAPSLAVAREKPGVRVGAQDLRGDLDTIVLTAIAKESERRYATVEALANDIRRYLEGMPISARAESAWYRVHKFVRRNSTGVIAAAIVAIALIGATAVSLRQARIATEQAGRAEQKSKTAEAVKDYLQSVFSSANPYNTDGKLVTARDLLEGGLEKVDQKLAGQPEVQAEIYSSFAGTFSSLDRLDQAKQAAQRALQKYREFLPDDSLQVLRSEEFLGELDLYSTHLDGLADRLNKLLAKLGDRTGGFAAVRADVLDVLTLTYYRSGDFNLAAQVGADSIKQRLTLNGDAAYETDIARYDLSLIQLARGRADEAAEQMRIYVGHEKVGPEHPGLITDVVVVARLLDYAGRLRESQGLMTAAVAARRAQFGDDHAMTLTAQTLLAQTQSDLGDDAGAEAMLLDVVGRYSAKSNAAGDDVSRNYSTLAFVQIKLGKLAAARAALTSARARIALQAPATSPIPTAFDAALAEIDRRDGRPVVALSELDAIVARQRLRDDRDLPASLLTQARAGAAVGKSAEALFALAEASSALTRQDRSASTLGRELESEWAAQLGAAGKHAAAAEHWQRVAEIGCVNFGCDDARVTEWIRLAATENGGGASPESIASIRARITQSSAAQGNLFDTEYDTATRIIANAAAAKINH